MIYGEKIRKQKTAWLKIYGIGIIVFFAVFFTSGKWIVTKEDLIEPTKLYVETEGLDNYTRETLYRWDYSPSQNLMEIEFSIRNTAIVGDTTYRFVAGERTAGQLKVKAMTSDPSMMVVQISDVPSAWKEIYIRTEINNENAAVLYMNKDDINIVRSLSEKSESEYIIGHCEDLIYNKKLEILELNEDIKKCEELISDYENKKDDLENQTEYMTEKEKNQLNSQMASYNSSISGYKTTISGDQKSIEELMNQISKLEKKIEDIRGNNETE